MKNKGNTVLHTLSAGKIGLNGEKTEFGQNQMKQNLFIKEISKGPTSWLGVEYRYIFCSFNLTQII